MTETTKALTPAEAELHAREKFIHDVDHANTRLKAAELAGDADRIRTEQTALANAIKARDLSGVTSREIDELTQAVLDERGEAHTETNILPPDHGLRTVDANYELAMAKSTKRLHLVAGLEKKLAEAEQQDADEKAAHVIESHERTIAALEETKA